jgi:hypothetical protein
MCGCSRVLLVDWEHSCQNDAAWDVVYFELAADLRSDQRERWRVACLGRHPTRSETSKLTLYSVALDALCGLWSACQASYADTNDERLLHADARRRLARATRAAAASGIA